ncbi:hypothetical protein EMCG_03984 [[Emmonsia] crescens]|uniref:Uncharacterized protein n=1 Tax=[Emmonsia] crescens TaxID=73230 RepID=A0A0G2HTJ0_9EURO|nr:hypothetical protein EMCG_03984 [Emmonsia crescens UAMH 3008]
MFTSLTSRKIAITPRSFHHAAARLLTTQARFYYLKDLPEYRTAKPYHINVPEWALPPGQQSNEVSVPYSNISVTGLRSQLHHFTLDRNGFQVEREEERGPYSLYDCIEFEEYAEEKKVKERVRPAVESFLKRKIPEAEDVIVFSSQVLFIYSSTEERQIKAHKSWQGLIKMAKIDSSTRLSISSPTSRHRFQQASARAGSPRRCVLSTFLQTENFAPDSARAEVAEFLTARGYSNLAGRRWQIISVWKPLFGPLQDWPLGLLDYTSIDNTRDLVASDNIYPHVIRETYNVIFNGRHKWYYLEDQQPDEVLVFKGFDTHATRGHARLCPHASFTDPLAPATARPRESFECQSVVIYPEGSAINNTYEEILPSESL